MPEQLPSLLLIDDDETFLRVLGRALQRRGHTVFSASSPDEAIALARSEQPDQAVVDLNLGATSGLQLMPELLAASPKTRALILTGYSSIATAVEAIKLGAVNYLCKPASAEEILHALKENAGQLPSTPASPPSVDRLEWEHIQRVLADNLGNVSATARALGMHRRTLQRKLKKRPVKE